MTTLDQLALGKRARVMGLTGHDEIALRLLEMGITPGVEVVLVGAAPLGDPIEITVRGYRLSLRRSEAQRISIEAF